MKKLSKITQWFVVTIVVAITLQMPTMAHAVMSEAQIASKLEATFDVKVLKILRSAKLDSGIIAVKVMNPSGSSNNALQVYTLFVNEETGNPVPLYGEFVSRLPRTSPLIWQRTIPVTADDEDQLNP
tara:strand:- start:91102 stop:91482 length:381 start_codon:yes stop_codon:yes gene_type:complete